MTDEENVNKEEMPNSGGLQSWLESPRAIPTLITVLICLLLAVASAYTLWLFFGRQAAPAQEGDQVKILTPAPASPLPLAVPRLLAPAGELPVAEGVVTIGGEDYDIPLKKVAVEKFFIAETEVTHEQYAQFIKDTNHKAPPDWKDGEYAVGKANEPVVMVTWQDAVDYCQWLAGKIAAEVRLPSEAEWELAARGKDNFRYPWGNDWDERAAASAETNGQIRPVKSYPQGRSSVGAYDLAGNVWEWVQDEAVDTDGTPIIKDGRTYRIAKGGAANEPKEFFTCAARSVLPPNKPRKYLGFRYIVIRK